MAHSVPTVSIIIPTYYRNDFLEEAIESVYNQSYRPIEVIVVDDSGEKHAERSITKYDYDSLSYIPLEENQGQNAALNRGLQEATGEYVQFLDDDDQVIGEKFARQVSLLEEQSTVGVAYCSVKTEDGEIHQPDKDGRGDVLQRVLQFDLNPCVTSTMLMDADCLSEITPLPTPPGSTDIYMKIELAQVTNFDFITEPGILKRDTQGSVGSSREAIIGHERVFEEYQSIYQQFPNEVQRMALGKFYNRKGSFLVHSRRWSPSATLAFAKAVYYSPGISVPYLGRLFGSAFGQPGVLSIEYSMTKIKQITS